MSTGKELELCMLYYFAYGSNLHPLRLRERVPSARLLGTCDVRGFRLAFHKQGADGSGKCNLHATDHRDDLIHGAIYTLASEHKCLLDKFEGRGFGYLDHSLRLKHGKNALDCFTYLAQDAYIQEGLQPYHWYKELVVQGARHLRFPQHYVAQIEGVSSLSDPEQARRREHEQLLGRIRRHSVTAG